MKKRIVSIWMVACMAFSFTACGSSGNEETEVTEGTQAQEIITAERTQLPEVLSVDMDIDYEKQVTSLCDYKGIELTINGKYDVTDEEMDKLVLSELSGCGADLIEVTNRKKVKKDDIVNVDFSGSVDGKKMKNGSATDQYLDIANNQGYIGLNPFVEGFCEPVVGAKVGSTVTGEVTFPSDYSLDETMAGKTATFTYKINAIYEKCTDLEKIKEIAKEKDNRVDKMINEWYSKYSVTNLNELIEFVNGYVEYQLSSQKNSDIASQVRAYMSNNCEVEIPEEYLEARLTEYFVSFEKNNLAADESLADYLSKNDPDRTVDGVWEEERNSLKEQIRLEFIFGLIAQKEGIAIDEEEFQQYVQNVVSSNNYGFESEEDVYNYFGAGNAENGKKYVQNLYLINKAITVVGNEAKVTIKEAEKSTETEE